MRLWPYTLTRPIMTRIMGGKHQKALGRATALATYLIDLSPDDMQRRLPGR